MSYGIKLFAIHIPGPNASAVEHIWWRVRISSFKRFILSNQHARVPLELLRIYSNILYANLRRVHEFDSVECLLSAAHLQNFQFID